MSSATSARAAFQSMEKQFLVAMPGMLSDIFDGGLIYICSHDAEGAMGFMVNRPTNLSADTFLNQDSLLACEQLANAQIYFGGPVNVGQGFILHRHGQAFQSTLSNGQVAFTKSRDIFDAIARHEGPEDFMLLLGYSGWSSGQLEQELADNCWLTLDADPDIIFTGDFRDRYRRALASIGIDPLMLTSQAGHA